MQLCEHALVQVFVDAVPEKILLDLDEGKPGAAATNKTCFVPGSPLLLLRPLCLAPAQQNSKKAALGCAVTLCPSSSPGPKTKVLTGRCKAA